MAPKSPKGESNNNNNDDNTSIHNEQQELQDLAADGKSNRKHQARKQQIINKPKSDRQEKMLDNLQMKEINQARARVLQKELVKSLDSSEALQMETESEDLNGSSKIGDADDFCDRIEEDDELYGLAESDNLLISGKVNSQKSDRTRNCIKSVTKENLLELSSSGSTSSMSGDSQSITNYSSSTQQNSDADYYLTPPMKRAISQTMLQLDSKMRNSNINSRSFQIEWKQLNYSYKQGVFDTLVKMSSRTNNTSENSGSERILKNLSGSLKSNQLVAIVGPSGCGKTTLLQLLSGNMPIQQGELTIQGIDEPRVSFIGQHDPLLPDLTARETLIFASRLQNTRANFNHKQHVEPIIQALGLTECAHRKVQQLSGGQFKRVCIAQELLYPTNLLILDEITSGLDASTSYSIIKQLKKLTSDLTYPMTIVISIHQPSARLFAVFDKVYVMSSGRCLYEGGCNIERINAHLRLFNLECPKFNNIADFLIEIASDDATQTNKVREKLFDYHDKHNSTAKNQQTINERRLNLVEEKSLNQVETRISIEGDNSGNDDGAISLGSASTSWSAGGQQSQQTSKLRDKMMPNKLNETTGSERLSGGKSGQVKYPLEVDQTTPIKQPEKSLYDAIERARAARQRPFFKHFLVHFERSSQRLRRSYIFTYMQLLTYAFLGFQLTTFFGPDIGKLSGCPQLPLSFISYVLSSSDNDDEAVSLEMRRIQENVNFLLVVVMTATFAALEITVITFPLEAKTVKREWRNGRYRVSSYFVGRTLADLPIQIVCVLLFSLLTYSQTGQHGFLSWRFLSYCLILICCGLVAQTVGFLFGAIFMDSLPLAVFTAPLSIFPALLFSGFFARMNQAGAFYEYISRFSHFRYAFEALIVTLYGYGRCSCEQETLSQYHASLESQTSTMQDMFKTMLGVSGCPASSSSSPLDQSNSVEDTTGFVGDIDSFVAKDLATTTTSTIAPYLNLSSALVNVTTSSSTTTERPMKAFEDALIDSVYAHINSTTPSDGQQGTTPSSGSAVDMVMAKFTTKLTRMFNSRSNFGRPVPQNCTNFNSYLISEFQLKDQDLIEGLIILFMVVIIFRIICNILLTMTMKAKIN